MVDPIEFNRIYAFDGHEVGYIVDLLDKVYEIRTLKGEQDDILADFIQALDNAGTILIED